MKSWFPVGLLVVLCVGLQSARGAETQPSTGQHAQTFEKNGAKLDYLLYLPPDYAKDTQKKWPLIVFLHGSGERGTDVNTVKKHGPPKIVENEDSPLKGRFVVVSPQCPPKQWWKVEDLNALLDSILADYRIDNDRVYLTGLSMGGFGTYAWATQDPGRFAAIAPICGKGDASKADAIKNLPIWVFHGEKDTTVPIGPDEEMVKALKEAGDKDVKFTKYPDLGHDSWTVTYNNPELYEWFLKHKRGDQPAAEKAAK